MVTGLDAKTPPKNRVINMVWETYIEYVIVNLAPSATYLQIFCRRRRRSETHEDKDRHQNCHLPPILFAKTAP